MRVQYETYANKVSSAHSVSFCRYDSSSPVLTGDRGSRAVDMALRSWLFHLRRRIVIDVRTLDGLHQTLAGSSCRRDSLFVQVKLNGSNVNRGCEVELEMNWAGEALT